MQKDLCNAVHVRKRRLLGEARCESDEVEHELDGKRLLEQHCDWEVSNAENLPRRPEFCITCVGTTFGCENVELTRRLKGLAMLMQDMLRQWW